MNLREGPGRKNYRQRRYFDTPINVVMYPTPPAGPLTLSSAERRLHPDEATQLLHGRDGIERAPDNLPGPGSLGLIREPGFEQLGVGENHAQLVVEPMEDLRQVWRGIHRRLRRPLCGIRRHG